MKYKQEMVGDKEAVNTIRRSENQKREKPRLLREGSVLAGAENTRWFG